MIPTAVSKKIDLFLLCWVLVMLFSCNENKEYYAFNHIADGLWAADSVICLRFDSLPLDPSAKYNVDIEIVHNNCYPYRDLWLLIGHNLQDSVLYYDTLTFEISDRYGRWLGRGVGGLHSLSFPYKKNIILDSIKDYRFLIRQFMHEDPLPGVEKIGVKIFVTEDT